MRSHDPLGNWSRIPAGPSGQLERKSKYLRAEPATTVVSLLQGKSGTKPNVHSARPRRMGFCENKTQAPGHTAAVFAGAPAGPARVRSPSRSDPPLWSSRQPEVPGPSTGQTEGKTKSISRFVRHPKETEMDAKGGRGGQTQTTWGAALSSRALGRSQAVLNVGPEHQSSTCAPSCPSENRWAEG